MITTDVFLEIGSQHRECEDYIISGYEPFPYIILSDGCSSSNNTEMGARILCHLAKQYMKYHQDEYLNYKNTGSWIIHNAEMVARQLGLPLSCLDATLIIAYFRDGYIHVSMYGDGSIITKKNNNITIYHIDYSNNAPFYLSYQIDDIRHGIYHSLKNDLSIKTISPDGEKCESYAYDFQSIFTYRASDIDCLFITSDGISSFIVESPTERRVVSEVDILPDFMNFKNVKGEFLTRRLKKALKNLKSNDVNHYDDLSVGSFISIEE
jgi:hypothetical protein